MAAVRVSILLPVLDAEATLPSCLLSIGRQRERNWECVIVDDGSRDASRGVARRFAEADRRFRVIARAHTGLVATLNAGLEHCRGRFVARMDADDVMHGERLALQADALEGEPQLDALGTHVRLFPRRGFGPGMRAYERWLASIDSPGRVREEAFVECPVAHPTLMMRRELLAALRYRDLGWPEDYDLILRLLEAGRQVSVLPRRLLAWRQRPGRLSQVSETYAIRRFTACKACFLARTFLARTDRYLLWGYGSTGKALQRALRAHAKRPAAIVERHPRRLGEHIHGAPVIPPEALRGPDGTPLVVSVAREGARNEIRRALTHAGFRETVDYVCAA